MKAVVFVLALIISGQLFANQKLLDATKVQNHSLVKQLLSTDTTINLEFGDKDGMTSLAHAAKLGNLRIFKTLWRAGASTQATDKYGTPVAIHAYIHNHLDIFNILNRYDEYTTNLSSKMDEVFSAVQACDIKTFKKLIDEGVRIEFKNSQDQTVVQVAITYFEKGCSDIIKTILEKEIFTALHSLTFDNVISILPVLRTELRQVLLLVLKLEFNLSVDRNQSYQLYSYFGYDIRDEMFRDILMNGKTDKLSEYLFVAVRRTYFQFTKLLVRYGANPNVLDHNNRNLFFYTFDVAMAKYLAGLGLNINHQDSDRATPLTYLTDNSSDINLVKTLVELGADVNLRDKWGNTALINCGTSWNRREIANYLIDAGTNINFQYYEGKTYLMIMAETLLGWYPIDSFLHKIIDHPQIDFSIKDNIGNSIFYYVLLEHFSPEFLPFLLKKNIDINIKSKGGVTPLMHAADNLNVQNVKLLLEHGADTTLIDNKGRDVTVRMKQSIRVPFHYHLSRRYRQAYGEDHKRHRQIMRMIRKARKSTDS